MRRMSLPPALLLGLSLAWAIAPRAADARDLRVATQAPAPDALRHESEVVALAISSDGRLCATGSAAPECSILLWDLISDAPIRRLTGHRGSLRSLDFSPDGATLASAGGIYRGACQVRLWDVATGECRKTITNGANEVRALAYSPDGTLLAGCDDARELQLWDARSGESIKSVRLAFGYPTSVAFAPDGSRLVVTSGSRAVLLDVRSGAVLQSFDHGATATGVAWSSDGAWIASAGGEAVKLWDVGQRALHASYRMEAVPRSIAFSPRGTELACSDTVNRIRVWSLASGRMLDDIAIPGWQSGIPVCAFLPDGGRIAAACEHAPRLLALSR